MSYLNALASNGLSVGLRFYNVNKAAGKALEEPQESDIEIPEIPLPGQTGKETELSAKKAEAPIPQTPEEMAAGRAEALAKLEADGSIGRFQTEIATENGNTAEGKKEDKSEQKGDILKELSPEEKEQLQKLKARDIEVKSHEAAHIAASGGRAGSPSYSYQTGPDGQKYAVGGEVSVQSGGGSSTPEEALRDAEAVQKSATAPADPSSQDQAVAANAAAKITQLRSEIQKEKSEVTEEDSPDNPNSQNANAAGSEKTSFFNGASLMQKVTGAYNAVKFGLGATSSPSLARI